MPVITLLPAPIIKQMTPGILTDDQLKALKLSKRVQAKQFVIQQAREKASQLQELEKVKQSEYLRRGN